MMVLLSLMSGTTIKAQFNTVGRLYNHQVQKTKNPQEFADELLERALACNNGYAVDDMTVIVVKILDF